MCRPCNQHVLVRYVLMYLTCISEESTKSNLAGHYPSLHPQAAARQVLRHLQARHLQGLLRHPPGPAAAAISRSAAAAALNKDSVIATVDRGSDVAIDRGLMFLPMEGSPHSLELVLCRHIRWVVQLCCNLDGYANLDSFCSKINLPQSKQIECETPARPPPCALCG